MQSYCYFQQRSRTNVVLAQAHNRRGPAAAAERTNNSPNYVDVGELSPRDLRRAAVVRSETDHGMPNMALSASLF
ncbi:hypothetical protein EVAR_52181_1 [Eumeta japonica]|uniref:Uncharacterized protein n=1 Tax=Eumeta variegata TaxID=151549 RepID=A0A4C1YCY6_EUMVA|nr:hypothetical protein EVAR_52181_1 [Eumeta japonica]